MTINRLGQLIRFASTSFGTSTPAAAASDSRSVLRKPFCDRAIRSVSGSSVERCSWVRTACSVSASSTRQVEATARSMPTTTATVATAAARSRSVRMAGADDEARRKSRRSGPCAVTRTVSGLSAPCEIPAFAEDSTERRYPSTSSSPTCVASKLGEPFARRQPRDERRRRGPARNSRRHNFGDQRAGVSRQEGQVRLVLHLLQPVEHERGSESR